MAEVKSELFELISLLSRIKIKGAGADLRIAASHQYLFPLIGAILGFLVTFFAWFLFQYAVLFIGIFLVAVIICIALFFLTGIIHIEGLADFGDGLMASGDREKKRTAMKDVSLGAGGTFLMIIDVTLLIALISLLVGTERTVLPWIWGHELPLVLGIIIAEISAKLAMITAMKLGPSSHEGMGSTFIESSTTSGYIVGLILASSLGILFAGIYGLIVFAGVISGVLIVIIARRHFGGIGGDGLGASNEIGRLAALLAWVILL